MNVTSRPAQLADRAAIDALIAHADVWEPTLGPERRLFEIRDRIVAVSSGHATRIARPSLQPAPVGTLESPVRPGEDLAFVGRGMLITSEIDRNEARMIHRLARTLQSDELGARWCVVCAALPELPGYTPGEIAQQIAAGAIDFAPVTIPLEDGFWPIGTSDDAVVLVRRATEF